MELKSVALAVLFLVHGSAAKTSSSSKSSSNSACQPGDVDNVVNQLDQFNNLLVGYAKLGSSAIEASVVSTSIVNHGAQHPATTAVQQVRNNQHPTHVAVPTSHLRAESSKPLKARAVETSPDLHHSHVDNKKVEHNTIQLVAVKSTVAPSSANRAEHQQRIQNAWKQLQKQQVILKSIQDTCIPDSHKLKVAGSLKNVLQTYLVQETNLKAAGSLVEEPPKKMKKSKKIKRSEQKRRINAGLPARTTSYVMQEHQAAGWLTMDNDVNGGYNGDNSILTMQTSSTPSSTYSGSTIAYVGEDAPEYTPMYVTVTTTSLPAPVVDATSAPSNRRKVAAAAAKSSGAADSASESSSDSSGTSSESDSEDDSASTMPTAPSMAAPSSAHHNIIYRLFDGTLHLITGTLHFAEHILGSIFIEDSSELSKLVKNIETKYRA